MESRGVCAPTFLLLLRGCCYHISLSLLPPHELAAGRGTETGTQEWEQPMAWEGKAQTPEAGATPSHSSGNKHTSERRNHQEIAVFRKALVFSIKSLPLSNTRPGFCVCPNLALSLWKGLFVKCFVLMSPALISPCQPPAPRIPLHSQVLLHPALPRGRYPAAPAFHNRYPRGSKVPEDFSFN